MIETLLKVVIYNCKIYCIKEVGMILFYNYLVRKLVIFINVVNYVKQKKFSTLRKFGVSSIGHMW